MTDKEYIDNFSKQSEQNKHELKTMMYCVLDNKRINWNWGEDLEETIIEQS